MLNRSFPLVEDYMWCQLLPEGEVMDMDGGVHDIRNVMPDPLHHIMQELDAYACAAPSPPSLLGFMYVSVFLLSLAYLGFRHLRNHVEL